MSGQGPYFGQASWFKFFHRERIPSAVDRYIKEIRRVTGVLDMMLKDKQYLTSDRVSYADFSFVPWYWLTPRLDPELADIIATSHPNFEKWWERMIAKDSVKKVAIAWEKNMVKDMHL